MLPFTGKVCLAPETPAPHRCSESLDSLRQPLSSRGPHGCRCPAQQQRQGSRKQAGIGGGTGRAWGPGPGIAHPAEQAGRHAFSGCELATRHQAL